jgi:hypothetical protein
MLLELALSIVCLILIKKFKEERGVENHLVEHWVRINAIWILLKMVHYRILVGIQSASESELVIKAIANA